MLSLYEEMSTADATENDTTYGRCRRNTRYIIGTWGFYTIDVRSKRLLVV